MPRRGEHRIWAFRIERVQVALDRVTGDSSEEDVQKCPQKVIFGERFIRFAQTRILTLRLNKCGIMPKDTTNVSHSVRRIGGKIP